MRFLMPRCFYHLCVLFFVVLFSSCAVSCYNIKQETSLENIKFNSLNYTDSFELKDGCTFVVNNVIDLKGGFIKFPANVFIRFKKGGAIINGKLIGNKTKFDANNNDILGVVLEGTWCVEKISDLTFKNDCLTEQEIINNINIIQSDSLFNDITIFRDITVGFSKSGGAGLNMSSNSNLLLKGKLIAQPNDFKSYNIINIQNKENVHIIGGTVIGDVGHHFYVNGSTSEWGMGINILESKNVVLEDMYITHCTGDGIYISGGNESTICTYNHASKNIQIHNVICDDNRRQGISIIHVDGLTITNSKFINTGKSEFTGPGSGIDFEPNVSLNRNMSIRNIKISNCKLYGNKGKQIGSFNAFFDNHQTSFENIYIENTQVDGLCYIAGDMNFENCTFRSITVRNSEMPVHAYFHNCTVAGGEGVCIVIQEPIIQYKAYEKNRSYSIIFDNCTISLNESHYDEKYNGLFYYKGNNNVYDGKMLIKECVVNLPKNHKMNFFRRPITGDVVFERSTINATERPLDLGGATYINCLLNCDYIRLNTTRFGKDVLKECRINTKSTNHVFFLGQTVFTGEGYEIENCYFSNFKAHPLVKEKGAKTKIKAKVLNNKYFDGSLFHIDNN